MRQLSTDPKIPIVGIDYNKDRLGLASKYLSERYIIDYNINLDLFIDFLMDYGEKLQGYGTVFITSETELPHNLEQNRLRIKPNKIHDLLYYSSLYIGEGATMASEAAILGVPAIFVSSLRLGYLAELEEKYGLAFSFNNSTEALDKAIVILNTKEFKKEYNAKRELLLKDKIDVTRFMTSCITSFQ